MRDGATPCSRLALAPVEVICRSMSRAARGCLIAFLGAGLLVALAAGCAWAWLADGPFYEREASPSGAYDVIRETRSFFLDGYTSIWITRHGEEDRDKWLLIGREVDGTYFTDWGSPTELFLTNYGWPKLPEPFTVTTFGEVRIEVRRPPRSSSTDSPDGYNRLDIFTYEDSRGRRSGAMLATNWNNPTPGRGGMTLCAEGPWSIEGTWLANDHVELRIDCSPPAPRIPSRWHEIRITVVE